MKKTLPTISAPTLVVELPISKIKVKYRPFVIKEQKALLLAQESKDADTVLETIKSVLESCTSGTLDFSKIPTADLAYFFVQIRIASVGPEVKFQDVCEKCENELVLSMSLSDVSIDTTDIKTNVKITNDVGIIFRLPTVTDVFDLSDSDDRSTKMLYTLIESVYDADSVYEKSDYTEEEFVAWIENMNEVQVSAIKEFVDSIPELSHTLKFTCSNCGHEQSRTLEGLHNFFRFGASS
jgi:hypothetical protein